MHYCCITLRRGSTVAIETVDWTTLINWSNKCRVALLWNNYPELIRNYYPMKYYHESLHFLERNGSRFVHWSKRVTWFGCHNTIPVISGTLKWIKSACMHQCSWPLIDWLHIIVHINSIILLHTVSIFSNLRHGCCAGAYTFKSGDCWKILPTSLVQWRYVGCSVCCLTIVEVVLEWPASWLLIEILFRPTLLVISIQFVFFSRVPLWISYIDETPHFCKTWFTVFQTTQWNVCGWLWNL